ASLVIESSFAANIKEDKFEQILATVKAIGTHCYVFVENGKTVSDKAIENVQKTFDEKIYPTDTTYFGSEWKPGIDGDERITLLLLDIRDGFDPQSNPGYVAGYFFAGDEFLQSQIPADVPVKSNEREMFYLDIHPSNPEEENYMGVVAHEFQHMIHFAQDPQEFTWVNEGCSMMAMQFCGYRDSVLNHIAMFMKTPDNSMPSWSDEQTMACYGEVYLWNYYLMHRYLGEDEATRQKFFRELVENKKQGGASYDEALKPFKTDFTTAFQDFCVTNFINSPKMEQGQFAYDKSLGRLRLPASTQIKAVPGKAQEKVFPWSGEAIKVDLTGAKTTVKVEFGGPNVKVTEKDTLKFTAFAVFSDSRDAQVPMLKKIETSVSPDKKLQVGAVEVSTSGKYDTLNVIVTLTCTTAIPDQAFKQVKDGIPYIVQVSDSGIMTASGNTRRIPIRPMIDQYVPAAATLVTAEGAASEQALTTLEGLTHDITREVKGQLEAGSLSAVKELIEAASDAQKREALRPLAKKVADQVSASKVQSQSQNVELESMIKQLRDF
ncbi:MAG TPA: hypothetical protein PKO06_19985, partial [Candidatus Ozemobacteraceae bacterium]|nr:hypothetical protein [Candidatus Ozemobacteraceae bacterium]